MAISNYAELQTAVATTWQGGRTDLNVNVKDFITLGEAWLNRALSLQLMRATANLTGTIGSNVLALPLDYIEPFSLYLTTYNTQQYMKPTAWATAPDSFVASPPTEWMIGADGIQLNHPCDFPHTFLFNYRKAFALSDAQPTNYLLTKWPDMYLAASLVEAFAFAKDNDALQLWGARRGLTKDEVAHIEARSLAIGTLETDIGGRQGGFNIYSGE